MTEYVEFTAMHENVEIRGYLRLDEANYEDPLCFYNEFGFEISHYPNNPFSEDEDYENWVKWEKLSEWFHRTDIIQWLVDSAHEQKAVELHDGDNVFYLYINREPDYDSLHECVVEDKSTTIRIKQSTKEILSEIGSKNMTYEDIIMTMFHQLNIAKIERFYRGKAIITDTETLAVECFEQCGIPLPKLFNSQGLSGRGLVPFTEDIFKNCCEMATDEDLVGHGREATNVEVVTNVYCLCWDIPAPTWSMYRINPLEVIK